MWGKKGDIYRNEGLMIQGADAKNRKIWNVLKTQ